MAAKHGFDKAQYNLGKMYRNGIGTARDQTAASDWFLKAAMQGYPKAQRNIGRRMAAGTGIDKDGVRGLVFMILAAKKGIPNTFKKRDEIAASLTAEERAKAERMAEDWKPAK